MSRNIDGTNWGGADRERGMAFHFSAADSHHLSDGNQQQPKPGDLCIADRHVGDHYHTYIVCRRRSDGLHVPKFTFAAYEFGQPLFRLTPVDYLRVEKSEIVNLTPYSNNPFPDDPNCHDNSATVAEFNRVKTINEDISQAEAQLREVWDKINPPPVSVNRDGDSITQSAFKKLSEQVGFKKLNFHTPNLDHLLAEGPMKKLTNAFAAVGVGADHAADSMKMFEEMFMKSFGVPNSLTGNFTSPVTATSEFPIRARYRELTESEREKLNNTSLTRIEWLNNHTGKWQQKTEYGFKPEIIYRII